MFDMNEWIMFPIALQASVYPLLYGPHIKIILHIIKALLLYRSLNVLSAILSKSLLLWQKRPFTS